MVSGAWRILILLAFVLLSPRLASARESHWPQVLTLGTASEGGTYYVYGEGLARLLSRELGIAVVARPTGGPVDNIKLLETGEIQLAFVTQGVALQAWNASAAAGRTCGLAAVGAGEQAGRGARRQQQHES